MMKRRKGQPYGYDPARQYDPFYEFMKKNHPSIMEKYDEEKRKRLPDGYSSFMKNAGQYAGGTPKNWGRV